MRLFRRSPAKRRGTGAGYVFLIALLVCAYFVPRGEQWNADSHLFLTASIVDRGAQTIDPFAPYTQDIAFANGHYYADKAPGLSFAAIPVYALLKYTLLGGKPYLALFSAPPAQRVDFLPRYLLAIVYAGVPTALLAALLYGFLARFGLATRWRALVALTYALGTIARPFAQVFYSHQFAALLVFGAFLLAYRVRHGELRTRWLALAGALLGYAVITEYPTALIAAVIAVYVLAPSSACTGQETMPPAFRSRVGPLVLGALPPLALGALYNTLAFGGPLSQGYARLAGPEAFRVGQAQGVMGVTYPHLDALWQTTFGPYRGIFLLSPFLLLALPGGVLLWRRREWRAEARLWLAIVAVYALFTVSYYAWDGGYSMGPRHFLPALPFLMLPIAETLRPERARPWRIAAVITALWSLLVVELATAVSPLVDPRYSSPLTQWALPRLLSGGLDNNWGMLFHLPGLLELLPLLLAVGLVALRWRQQARTELSRSFLP